MKEGWRRTTLGEVCEIIMGQSPDGDSYNVAGEGVPLINGPVEFSQGWFGKTIRSKFTTHPTKFCRENDLILCVRGSTTGRMNIAAFDACIGRGVAAIRGKEYQPWVNYFVSSKRDDIHALGTGATFPNVSVAMLSDLKLLFPPVAEQQRIVGILDEAFDGIVTAKANAEKNLQNARALFESHLEAVFTQRGEGWVDTTIGQHIRFIDYRGKTPEKIDRGLRLITAKNVRMGYLQETPMEFVAADSYGRWMTRGIPRLGDVLFTTEAPLANVAQLDTNEKVVFAQRIIIMQPDACKLDSTFLKYLLLSRPVQQRIRSKGTGATVQGIKASLLRTVELSFPSSLAHQRQIVAKLDQLAAETQRLEAIYQKKLTALDELKKSLLHQAFTGQL